MTGLQQTIDLLQMAKDGMVDNESTYPKDLYKRVMKSINDSMLDIKCFIRSDNKQGKYIRNMRESLGMTQTDVAKLLGITQNTLLAHEHDDFVGNALAIETHQKIINKLLKLTKARKEANRAVKFTNTKIVNLARENKIREIASR